MKRMLGVGLSLLLVSGVSSAEIVDRIAAVVNGEIILLSEVEAAAGPGLPPPDAVGADAKRRHVLLERAVDELVSDELVSDVAKEQGLEPAPAEIDGAIENVMRENRIDKKGLEGALAQQGMTMATYREMLAKQLTRMKVAEVKVRPRVNVTEDDVRRRYNEMTRDMASVEERRVRDVFLPADGEPEAARARAEDARARVLAGESFEQVARDAGGPLADEGGDLGWVGKDAILPELEATAFSLRKGEVSRVVEAAGGFHVLYVENIRTIGSARSLAESRDDIRAQLFAERMAKATEEWLGEIRRTADVEVRIR